MAASTLASTPGSRPSAEELLGQADAQARGPGRARRDSPAPAWDAGGVAGIEARHGLEQQGGILGVRVMGPAWSRLEAKAIMPQRETRP
jgi:hypothetical protein